MTLPKGQLFVRCSLNNSFFWLPVTQQPGEFAKSAQILGEKLLECPTQAHAIVNSGVTSKVYLGANF
jgi:hypothetical protein